MSADYLLPAYLDDMIEVQTNIKLIKNASLVFTQKILNLEKKGKIEKNGLNNIGKNDPNPVTKTKIVVIQKNKLSLSGFFNKAPKMAKIMATNPR